MVSDPSDEVCGSTSCDLNINECADRDVSLYADRSIISIPCDHCSRPSVFCHQGPVSLTDQCTVYIALHRHLRLCKLCGAFFRNVTVDLVLHRSSISSRPYGEAGYVDGVRMEILDELDALLMIPFSLTGKSGYQIRRYTYVGISLSQAIDDPHETIDGVMSSHFLQYRIATALYRYV